MNSSTTKLLVALFLLLGQASCLKTKVEFKCTHDCHNNGFCISSHQQCSCEDGFFEDDCSKGVTTADPTGTAIMQAVLSLLFFCTLVVSSACVFYGRRHINDTEGPASRIRWYLFVILASISGIKFFINSVDPYGQRFILPEVFVHVMQGLTEPLSIIAYILILFHWIEIVQISVKTLNKENMLKQINKKYPGRTITLEDMIESVKVLRKFRVPFLVLSLLSIIVEVLSEAFTELHVYPVTFNSIWTIYFGLCWIGLTVGYIVYGRKLVALMPFQVSHKVRKLTYKITILSVINLIIFVLFVLINGAPSSHPGAAITLYFCQQAILAVTVSATLTPFVSFQKKFPFIDVRQSSSTSGARFQTTATQSIPNHSSGTDGNAVPMSLYNTTPPSPSSSSNSPQTPQSTEYKNEIEQQVLIQQPEELQVVSNNNSKNDNNNSNANSNDDPKNGNQDMYNSSTDSNC